MIRKLKNKRTLSYAGLAAVCGLLAFSPVNTYAKDTKFTDMQTAQIQDIIKDYLTENPQIIMESIASYQVNKQKQLAEEAALKLKEIMPEILNGKAPSAGNPLGDVTVVEFFDYNCGYCKQALIDIQTIIDKDKNVNFIFKEMPILGPTSLTAAQWALAAHKQDKYFEYHVALMEHRGPKNEAELSKLAKKLGLDVERMQKDASSDEVAAQIDADLSVARSIGIGGTPAFIVDGELKSGYLGPDGMTAAIAAARDK